MADTVNYLLEKMVPELEDLERRKLFDRKELKEIVRKRTNFEYLLKRKAPLKDDFLRYIEYEKDLEALRKIRKARISKQLKASNLKWKDSLCDRAITRRIMFIYERAVRKFKADLEMWFRYLEYCRAHGGTRQIQKVITRALSLHANVIGLWIYGASWEFEQNLNHSGARALMMQGLRINVKSESLWLEYLRMELAYVGKLKARQVLLGTVDKQEEEKSSVEDSEIRTLGIQKLDELATKLSSTIFQNAIDAIPSSLDLRLKFFNLLKLNEFDGTEIVKTEILESITKDFSSNPLAIDALARRKIESLPNESISKLEEAIQIYEEGLSRNEGQDLYRLFSVFLEERISHWKDSVGSSNSQEIPEIVNFLLQLYQRAHDAKMSDEPMAESHLSLLLKFGNVSVALETARKLSEGLFKKSGVLWHKRMSLELQVLAKGTSQNKEKTFLKPLFRKAWKHVPLKESIPLWELFLEVFGSDKKVLEDGLSVAEQILSQSHSEGASELSCLLVKWILHFSGLSRARQLADRFLLLPFLSCDFLMYLLTLEAEVCEQGEPTALQRIRKVGFKAISLFGNTNADIWIHLCKLELQVGTASEANSLYWKAKKELEDPMDFMARYQELVSQ